ncbi:PAS domain-containing protein [Haloarchaeobius sp. DFWS5]|uniref:PAS domain-containing protein n=1 Tax=Haloarchaeobius sp. DFWS5 TaxID=3446114 RepID=UPI003EB6D922
METEPRRGIRVLYVDDDRSLLDATKQYLEGRFDDLSVETTDSAIDALDRIAEESFDVVVSDYQMPRMDGLEFLKRLREEYEEDLPFIIFTGKGREEVAMEALNLGANRYLQKGGDPTAQYGLLAQTIEQESHHHWTRSALKQREKDLRITLDSLADGVIATNPDGEVEWLNVVAEGLTGWDREAAVGEPLETVFHIEDARTGASLDCPVGTVLASESAVEFTEDTTLRAPDGTERYVEATAAPITDDTDAIVGVVLVFRDITERYLQERRQERQREAIIELARDDAIAAGRLTEAARRITETGAATLDVDRSSIWLFEDEALQCLDLYDRRSKSHEAGTRLAPENYPSYFEALETHRAIPAAKATTDPRTTELRESYLEPLGITSMLDATVRRGGEVVGVICNEDGGDPREWDEDEIRFAGELADQTVIALNNRDQRHREEVLERTNQRLGFLFDQSPMAVIEWTLDFEVARWNEAASELFGYSEAEAIGRHAGFIVPESSREAVDAVWDRLTEATQAEHIINRNVTKSGAEIDCEWHNRPILDEHGETVSVLSFVQDVTEQRRQTWQLQAIAERTQDAIYIKDTSGCYEFINEAGAAFFDLSPTEVVGRTDSELFDIDGDLLPVDRWVLEHEQSKTQEEHVVIDGREHVFLSGKYPHYDDVGRLIGIVGVSKDMTDRAAVDDLLAAFHETMLDSELSPHDRIEHLMTTLADSLKATTAQLCRVDEVAGVQEVVVSVGAVADRPVGTITPLEETFCKHVVDTGELVATYGSDVPTPDSGPADTLPVGSYVGAPVYVDEVLWGVVCFVDDSEVPTELTEDRCSMVELLADWLGHEFLELEYETELERRRVVAHDLAELLSDDLGRSLRDVLARTERAAESHEVDELETVRDQLDDATAVLDEVVTLVQTVATSERDDVDIGELAATAFEDLDQANAELVLPDEKLVVRGFQHSVERLLTSLFEAILQRDDGGSTIHVAPLTDHAGFVVTDDGSTLGAGYDTATTQGVTVRERVLAVDGLQTVSRLASANGWTVTPTECAEGRLRVEFTDVDSS